CLVIISFPPRCTLFPYTTLFRSVPYVDDFAVAPGGGSARELLEPPQDDLDLPRLVRPLWIGQGPAYALVFRCVHLHHPIRLEAPDRKSTRLNSSHVKNSYAVFCL